MVSWSAGELEMVIPSWCSLAGCVAVIATYALFYELRRFRHIELVFFVAVNDFFANLGTGFGFTRNGTAACWYQAFSSNFNYLSSAMWTVVMGYQLIFIVFGGVRIEDMTRFHGLCFAFPLIVALLPLTTNTYGNDGTDYGWCFIGTRSDSPSWGVEFWEIMSFYLWLWLCILAILIIYGIIAKRIWSLSTLTGSTQRTILRFSVYPCILVLCWGFNTYWNLSDNTGDSGLVATFPASQGFLNSIAFFVTNKRVRVRWLRFLGFDIRPTKMSSPNLNHILRIPRRSSVEFSSNSKSTPHSGPGTDNSYADNAFRDSTDPNSPNRIVSRALTDNTEFTTECILEEEDENYRPTLVSSDFLPINPLHCAIYNSESLHDNFSVGQSLPSQPSTSSAYPSYGVNSHSIW